DLFWMPLPGNGSVDSHHSFTSGVLSWPNAMVCNAAAVVRALGCRKTRRGSRDFHETSDGCRAGIGGHLVSHSPSRGSTKALRRAGARTQRLAVESQCRQAPGAGGEQAAHGRRALRTLNELPRI